MAHLKALVAPKQWKILRKKNKWVARPKPGPHNKQAIPLTLVLKNLLGVAENKREARYILQKKDVLVDGKIVKDANRAIGLMDVITLQKQKKNYRMTLDNKGRHLLIEISKTEADQKICRATRKIKIKKGQTQITFHDGKVMITKEKIDVGDSALIQLSKNKMTKVLKNTKGAAVLVIGGNHVGEQATIENYQSFKGVQPDKIELKTIKGKTYATLENYVLVLGEKKSVIKIQ